MDIPDFLNVGLTQRRVKEILDYDPDTGVFTRKISNRSDRVGKEPGSRNTKGYIQIRIDGKLQVAHRLAWLYVYGVLPVDQLDHINGDKTDNRITNLREVTNKQNQENIPLQINNTSGYRGVSYVSNYGKYRAYVCHHLTTYNLGYFDTPEEAAVAAKRGRDSLFTHHHTEYSS